MRCSRHQPDERDRVIQCVIGGHQAGQGDRSPFSGGGNRTHVAVPKNLLTMEALYHSATEVLTEFDKYFSNRVVQGNSISTSVAEWYKASVERRFFGTATWVRFPPPEKGLRSP